jgi:hypothetical protein
MTPAQRNALNNLRQQLVQRGGRIMRAASLTGFAVATIQGETFDVIGEWPGGRERRAISFDDHFSLRAGKVVEKESVCRFSQNIIRWLLNSRGL